VFVAGFNTYHVAYSLVPEGLELSGPVAVSGGDTEEDTIVLLEGLGVGEDHVVGLGRGVHLGEDLVVKGLLDLVDVDFTTSLSDTSGLLLDHLQDVAVHRVLSQLLAHRVHVIRSKLRARKKTNDHDGQVQWGLTKTIATLGAILMMCIAGATSKIDREIGELRG
jgi:hypothetical protein